MVSEKEQKALILLSFILILTLLIRLHHLDKKSFWLDEEFSVQRAALPPAEIITRAQEEPHPPLYYVLLQFWVQFTGQSETAIRLFSVICDLVTVLLIYFIGKALFSSNTGLLASLCFALSAFHVSFAQEARMYALLTMLTALSMYCFIKINVKPSKKSKYFTAAYLCASIALLYTHIYGAFILVAQNLWFLTKKNHKNQNRWFLVQSILILFYIPWLIILYHQMREIKSGTWNNITWILAPTFVDLIKTLCAFLYYNPGTIIVALAIGIMYYLNNKGTSIKKETTFLLTWLFTPILIPFLLSQITIPFYHVRYTVPASIAGVLLIAQGVTGIKKKNNKVLVTLCLIFLMITSLGFYFYKEKETEPWREAVHYIDANKAADEIIITKPFFTEKIVERYSNSSNEAIQPWYEGLVHQLTTAEHNQRNVTENMWLITRYENFSPGAHNITILSKKQFGNLTVYKIR